MRHHQSVCSWGGLVLVCCCCGVELMLENGACWRQPLRSVLTDFACVLLGDRRLTADMSVAQRCVTSVCFRWDSPATLDPRTPNPKTVHHSSLTWWTSSRTSSCHSALRFSPSSVRGPPVEFRANDLTNMAWDCREITILVLSLLQQCGCYPIDWTTAGTFGPERGARFCHTRGPRSTRAKFRRNPENGNMLLKVLAILGIIKKTKHNISLNIKMVVNYFYWN